MPITDPRLIEAQFHDPERHWLIQLIRGSAMKAGVPEAYALAVASKETNIHNIPGDHDHGHGPMQLDDRSHMIPAGWQQHPGPILDACCQLLKRELVWAQLCYPKLSPYRVAAAAYNCGRANTTFGINRGDCDRYTTGHNYGRDVCERMAVFARLL
jgi:hypothetical protein